MTGGGTTRAASIEQLAAILVGVAVPHPLRVAIDGRTAAGKTTLADELMALVERLGHPALRIGIDDFHLPRAERRGRGRDLPRWEGYYRHAFDHPAFRDALLPLGPGGDRRYRRAAFDSLRDLPIDEPRLLAPSDAIVLIDGVLLCRPELDDLWDFRIFVDIDAADSLRRGPPRDAAWLGPGESNLPTYHDRYIPGEDHYLANIRPRERADIIVDNRDPARPRLHIRNRPSEEIAE